MFDKWKLLQARASLLQGRRKEALALYTRLWEQIGQSGSLTALSAGTELATVLCQLDRYPEAEPLLLELLPRAEQLPAGRNRSGILLRLREGMALVCIRQKKISEGQNWLALGKEALDSCPDRGAAIEYCEVCARFYEEAGDYERAIEAARSSVSFGGSGDTLSRLLHLDQGTAADNLRSGYQAMDRPETGLTADACKKLGETYLSLGESRNAIRFAQQALSLCRSESGENSTETADAYLLLAESCLTDDQQPGGSEPEYQLGNMALNALHRAADILLKQKTAEPGLLTEADLQLSAAYELAGDVDHAEQYARDAMLTAGAAFPSEHPAVLETLSRLSLLYSHTGKHAKAYSYSREVLRRKSRGASAKDLTMYLWADLLLGIQCGQMPEPEELRALMNALEREPDTVAWLPQETLRLHYLRQMKNQREFCYQAALHDAASYSPEELYDFTLKTNNVDAQIGFAQAHFFRFEATPALQQAHRQAVRQQWTLDRYLKEGGRNELRLHQLSRACEEAQVQLLKQMGGVTFPEVGINVSVQQVQHALTSQQVLLEYGRFLWTENLKDYERGAGEDHYFGFAVTGERIRFADLGPAEEVDRLIHGLSGAMEAEASCGEWLNGLYRLLAEPFEAELRGRPEWIVVPDSTLYQLPFELLTDAAESSAENGFASVRYLSSGRELLKRREEAVPPRIRLIADPRYDIPEEEQHPGPVTQENRKSSDLRADAIAELPFTRVEAEEIAGLFGDAAQLFTGAQATKYLVEAPLPAHILHISTHGFACEPQDFRKEDLQIRQNRGRNLQQAEDPLLRCGLLFAGAVNWLRGETLSDEYGDGILTGSDLLAMDLSSCRLLILSACQTGLGQTLSGEGIKGLRRAFELAGAGLLVCTLWEVDDFASAVLMRKFYEELLAHPAGGAAEALSRAREFVRTVNGAGLMEMGWAEHIIQLHTLGYQTKSGENYANYLMTREHPFAHPHYWAGYILQG